LPPPHRLLFLDCETYYDDQYSLSKMGTPNYILDPRFEMIMLAVAESNNAPYLVDGPDVPAFFASVDPAHTTVVTFNSLFDMSIFSWRYGFVPSMMLDVMGMARALRGHLLSSASLATVARFMGSGEKGHALANVKGMHRLDILGHGLWHSFKEYAMQDVALTRDIFFKLLPEFPAAERRVMDQVLRCAVQPEFLLDVDMLQAHIAEVQQEKADALDACNVDRKDLMSAAKFAGLLTALGVDVELKRTATGNDIPALAKTDEFMASLLSHPDNRVQALAAARLGEKSTIEESRGLRLLSIAGLDWTCYRPGKFIPVPLAYGKAHTHRLAGDWLMNMQNLPSGRGGKPTKLRKALVAPPGHQVLVADLSQIEARITAWICGQKDLLEQFALDQDPYSQLGAKIFGLIITDLKQWKIDNPLARFIGKSGVLGLGFRCGASKFYAMVVRAARGLGMDMDELLKVWTEGLAQKSVDTYREVNKRIRNAWYLLDQMLGTAWIGQGDPLKFGPKGVVEIGHGYVLLPNGMKLNYANPRLDPDDDEYRYDYGKRSYKIHGGPLLENIVQALARIVVMHAMLRLRDRGLIMRLQSHDELAFIVPDNFVDEAKRIVLEEMRRRPSWAPDLPLDAAASFGKSYGDAK
jgi:DNA polymerase family A